MVLPVLTVSIIMIAHISRMVRSELVDVLHTDYIRAARLKGLPARTVLFRHAIRNALLPTITIVALDVGYLLGGVIVVEEIFALPGSGRQLIVAIQTRDLPSIQAGALIMASTYALANFPRRPRVRVARQADPVWVSSLADAALAAGPARNDPGRHDAADRDRRPVDRAVRPGGVLSAAALQAAQPRALDGHRPVRARHPVAAAGRRALDGAAGDPRQRARHAGRRADRHDVGVSRRPLRRSDHAHRSTR
jgi:hypothetical protein